MSKTKNIKDDEVSIDKKLFSSPEKDKEPNKKKQQEIYFMISYPRNQKENNKFCLYNTQKNTFPIPKEIFTKIKEEKKEMYLYTKVFMFIQNIEESQKKENKKHLEKKNENSKNVKEKDNIKKEKIIHYTFKFDIDDDNYIISFNTRGNSFIYDVELKQGSKILNEIVKENIDQKVISYSDKLDVYLETLKQDKDEKNKEEKINKLYEDTINLYSKKGSFSFLISLFALIYDKKNLCTKLLEEFERINKNKEENNKNMDRESYLEQFKSIINKNYSEGN